ncbi:ABC transporter permease subunit [Kumtagia ephedrae]|uniref:Putrescine/spermidine ABC transporter permease n=1 Tax=Kumtagia ephedrae TaxID=2116701 RepID=A0A2P7S4Z4_9HYPH|nr:ABC transporter permease subunit [Mesorhizobium ephedrae]PSJ57550.1 putrescine/spermidine ABC transporter permease [Mesorhizobium ephedrae]
MADTAVSSSPAVAAAQAAPVASGTLLGAITGRLVIVVPYLWLLVFFLVPFAIVFKISLSQTAIAMPPYTPVFTGMSDFAGKIGDFTADNYRILYCDFAGLVGLSGARAYCESFALDVFFDSPYIAPAYVSSIWIAGISTFLALLIAYPIAYGMARAPASIRPTLLMLVILPFWTSFLIRVYAWIGILKPEGLLNQVLLATGIIDTPLVILNTHTAIFIGIVYSYLPFMVLPLYSSLEKMDYSLIDAAQDLGCPPISAFWKITFPLSLPGVVAGCMLVFIPAVGEFVIPDLLGGSETLMIGKTLWNEFNANRDWPVSSAVAVILLLILIVPIMIFQNAQARAQEQGR